MSPNDLTHTLVAAVIALELYHLKLHMAIAADISDLKAQQKNLWNSFIRRYDR